MQTCCVGGGKTISDPPAEPMPKNRHWVHDGRGGFQTADPYRRIGARRKRAKERHRWGGSRIPGGERQRIVTRAALAKVYLLEKWDLGSMEGVKINPSHVRRDCGYKS